MSKLVCYLISTIIVGIVCGVHGSSLYKEQPVLTIMTEKGQIYDCMDFYKQPSFSNPLLKDHIREVKPTHLQNHVGKVKNLELIDGCPSGTVPILRSLINLTSPSIESSASNAEHCTAVIRTKGNSGRYFFRANGYVSIYRAKVNGNQWYASRMKLSNGPDSIEAGWMVNENVFSDTEAHLYARFAIGPTSCLNLQCRGFVQVSQDVALGSKPSNYSHIGDTNLLSWRLAIEQHQDDGHWWLSFGRERKLIGYWPKDLFTALKTSASQVEYGGEIDNRESGDTTTHPRPYMGSGLTARADPTLSAVYSHIKVVEDRMHYEPPKNTEFFGDCSGYYTALDDGNQGMKWGRRIFYGGPLQSI